MCWIGGVLFLYNWLSIRLLPSSVVIKTVGSLEIILQVSMIKNSSFLVPHILLNTYYSKTHTVNITTVPIQNNIRLHNYYQKLNLK